MVGQTISHYKITDKLGAGGMGVVYKALDLKLERIVALKFLPHEVAVNTQDKESLLREARAASALDHPNIGVIYGLEEAENHLLFIVMGYYEGETLAQKLGHGAFPLREGLDLAIQIAGGLSAAHARKIVHRDIKPSNIIITKDHVAKIVDFGLARVIASSSATQSLNTSGTLPYMAPEQVLGEPIDQRADVWALGVILVQMLTGSHPFLRENAAAMTFAILNQPPAALDVIPPLLQPIAYRALSKKPEHRYASAKEMLADLEVARLQIATAPTGMPQEAVTLPNAISARDLKDFVERASTPRWQTAAPQKVLSRRGLYVTLAVFLFAVASLLVPQVRERLAGMLTSPGEKHIAVLPFDNIGNDPANEPVAEGLMESMTSQLSNLDVGKQSLWVVPASVVRKKKVDDPSSALRELGANLVVKGSIARQGKQIRLVVNLIDAKSLRQIGSVPLEDAAGDMATLQNEAVARLARLMHIAVTAEMLKRTGGSVTPAAYESYLKALGYMQRYDKPGNLDLAVTELKTAVETDPRFALGYAQLGEAYRLKHRTDPNPNWIEESTANVNRALALDDRLPAAYVTLGSLHSRTGKDDLALQEFQRALQLDPHDVDAMAAMASAYERMGRLGEAEAAFQKAITLRPDYWDGYNSLGSYYNRHDRHAEAVAQYQKVIELTPDNAQAYSNMGAAYLDMGDPKMFPQAEAALKKSLELGPNYATYANLGNLYLSESRYADAAEMAEKALQLNDQDYRIWSNLLVAREWLKQNDKAADAREHMRERLEKLTRTQPQDAEAQSALAICYAEENLREKALQGIGKALALAPDDGHVLVDAGEVYQDLGDRGRALHYLQESLKKGTTMDDLKSRPQLQEILNDASFRTNGK